MDLPDLMDLLHLGIVTVTTHGKIIRVNQAARAILRASGVLSAFNGRLRARSTAHDRALTDAIGRVASGNGMPIGFSILRAGKLPVSVVVTRTTKTKTGPTAK